MLHLELARRNRRWTQTQLSQVTRIDQRFISTIERGEGYPTPDQLQRLATALNVSTPGLLLEPVEPAEALTMPRRIEAHGVTR